MTSFRARTDAGPVRASPALARFAFDLLLLVALVFVAMPKATGVAAHEWVSFGFIAILLVHILLGWRWFLSVGRRFLSSLGGAVRLNFVWDLALYVVMTVSFVSGVVVSESVLPAFGLELRPAEPWGPLHDM